MTPTAKPDGSEVRLERKFFVGNGSVQGVLADIRRMPGLMSEAFEPRFVNNLYLDTVGWGDYRANIDGLGERKKMRVRWYGEFFGKKPGAVLELKLKDGVHGRKIAHPLEGFEFSPTQRRADLMRRLSQAGLPDGIAGYIRSLRPVLVNRYRRRYYRSFDRALRVTVDSEISYYSWAADGGLRRRMEAGEPYIVLEMKYPPEGGALAVRAAQALSYRLSRHSKYVRGVEAIQPSF